MKADVFAGNTAAVAEALFSRCADGRLPHAVLLTGERGTGKTTLAGLLAKACVCTGAKKPCGVCPQCLKAAGGHPDIYYYNGDPETGSFKVDVIRSILEDIFLVPNEAFCNVMILDDAENLTPGAANALLKAIEDPPEHSRFILTATGSGLLPATIRSRLTEYRLAAASADEAAAFAAEKTGCSREDASAAAEAFGGNVGQLLSYLTDEHFRADCGTASRLIELIASGDSYGIFRLFDGFSGRKRPDATAALDLLRSMAIQALASKDGGAPPIGVTREELARIPSEKLLRLCDTLGEARAMLAANCQTAAVFALAASSI